MAYTAAEILTLAKAYSSAVGRSYYTVGRKICGNHSFIIRLDRGQGISTKTVARASEWFSANWPKDEPWPLDVPQSNGSAPDA